MYAQIWSTGTFQTWEAMLQHNIVDALARVAVFYLKD